MIDKTTIAATARAPADPDRLTATAIIGETLCGRRSVREVAEETLRLIEAREHEVKAFAYLDVERVRADAAALDDRPSRGALHGVTVAVKEMISLADMPTSCNTPRYRGLVRGADAACVDILRSAGALVVGTATMTEFAVSHRGPATTNPNAPGRTPGSSSSGSAAAVAAGFCAIGIGTQTGGSVIRPASYCGVFGFKPTWNVVSTEGVRTLAPTCDTVGFFARDTRDLILLANAYDMDAAPEFDTLAGRKVGVCRPPRWELAETGTRSAMDETARRLKAAGARVEDCVLPSCFDSFSDAHDAIIARELRTALLNEMRTTPELHPEIVTLVAKGETVSAQAAREAYEVIDRCRAGIDSVLAGYDFIIAPSATGEAPPGLGYTGSSALNVIWTILQVPVVSVPGQTGPSGAPVGVSVVTRRYTDRTAISAAALLAPCLSDGVDT
ncbi:amidase [Salipiger sp.]|uniref:amidase n=1 Tax=Salipiger sp. TaxID=2078585 RepID=UPI003A9708F2